MLVAPTGTFPKLKAAGLVLNAPEVVAFVEVELFLALVTPEQPDWTMNMDKIATNTRKPATGGILRLPDGIQKCPTH